MGADEKLRYKGLLREMADAVGNDNVKAYRDCLARFPDFAAAADYDYLAALKLREYDKVIEKDKGDFVRALCTSQELIGLPIVSLFELAGVCEPEDTSKTKGPLKPEAAMAMLDSPHFKLLLKNDQPKGLSIIGELITSESPNSTKVIKHFIEKSCPQHGIKKLAPLAGKFFSDVYKDDGIMAKASDVLIANISLFAPYLEPQQLQESFNAIVAITKRDASPDASKLQENRLRVIIDLLPLDGVSKAVERLGEQESGVKTLLVTKQARLMKKENLAKANDADTEIKFWQLPIEEQRDRLSQHIEDNNLEAFKTELVMLLGDPKNRSSAEVAIRRLSPLVDTIIRNDMGDFLKVCSANNIDILTEPRLEFAGLKDRGTLKNEYPLLPNVAEVMLTRKAFKEKVIANDPVIVEIMTKLIQDPNEPAPKFLSHIEALFIQNGQQEALNSCVNTMISQAVQENAAWIYAPANKKKVNSYINSLNTQQSTELFRSMFAVTSQEKPSEEQVAGFAELMIKLVKKVPTAEVAKLLPVIVANASMETLQRILEESGQSLSPADILKACCGDVSMGLKHREERTLETLNTLFEHNEFTEDQVFDALMSAIACGKPRHMAELLAYAKECSMDIVNTQNKEDGRTPLTSALGFKIATTRVEMADILVRKGADNRSDGKQNIPLSMMIKLKMECEARTLLEAANQEIVKIGFAGRIETARLEAQMNVGLQYLDALLARGLTVDQATNLLPNLLNGPSEGTTSHVRRIEKQDDTDQDTRTPGKH